MKNGLIDNISADLNLDSEVKSKLSLNMSSVVNGRDDAYVTPLCREQGGDYLLAEFNKVFKQHQSKLNPTLLKLEESNLAKVGPRSIASPWLDRKKSLIASFDRDNADTRFIDELSRMLDSKSFSRRNLRPLSINQAMKLLKNNTNSGLPYLARKGILKERVLNKFDILLKRKDPCVLFTRTQEQGKTRNVWGYPMADTLNEMCYYSPLLQYQRTLPYRSALRSPEMVSEQVTKLIVKAIGSGDLIQSIDFSSYDTTIKSKCQSIAFKYIKGQFQVPYHEALEYIAERFKSIGIVTPDGILKGDHGVPTGSTFTNEVDSICQFLIAHYLNGDDDWFQIQGDDGVYVLNSSDVPKLNSLFRSAGLIVNDDKSFLSNNYAVYLQCLYHIDYMKDGIIGGIYPVYRALNRILYQERWSDFEDYFITGKDFYSIRAICILENCKHHPLFEELVKFVLKYDKYSLEYSDKGLTDYVRMIDQTKGADEILNHQFGDNVSGMKSFQTVNLIKRLSS